MEGDPLSLSDARLEITRILRARLSIEIAFPPKLASTFSQKSFQFNVILFSWSAPQVRGGELTIFGSLSKGLQHLIIARSSVSAVLWARTLGQVAVL